MITIGTSGMRALSAGPLDTMMPSRRPMGLRSDKARASSGPVILFVKEVNQISYHVLFMIGTTGTFVRTSETLESSVTQQVNSDSTFLF